MVLVLFTFFLQDELKVETVEADMGASREGSRTDSEVTAAVLGILVRVDQFISQKSKICLKNSYF